MAPFIESRIKFNNLDENRNFELRILGWNYKFGNKVYNGIAVGYDNIMLLIYKINIVLFGAIIAFPFLAYNDVKDAEWVYRPNSFMRFRPEDNNQYDLPYPAPGHYGSTTDAMHHYYTMWYKLNQYYRYNVISKGQLIMLLVALLYDAMAFIGKHPWSQRNDMCERIELLDLQYDRTYIIL